MNIKTIIQSDLYDSIMRSYEAKQWKNVILDAIHYLSDELRNKTGLQSDGSSLVGQAFGGKNPCLRLNRLETETEKSIQSGMEFLLKGIYQVIRNPRSHEQIEDSQKDADTIVIFIDYILIIIGAAKSPFSIDKIVDNILDPNFVPNERYSSLLISEIPRRFYLQVAVEVYRKKKYTDCERIKTFINKLSNELNEYESKEFFDVVSNEVRELNSGEKLIPIFKILESGHWKKISEIARLRAENIVINEIKIGRYDAYNQRCITGIMATWSTSFWGEFILKNELLIAVIMLLNSNDKMQIDYAISYMYHDLERMFDQPPELIQKLLYNKIKKGSKTFYDLYNSSPAWMFANWNDNIEGAIREYKENEEEL